MVIDISKYNAVPETITNNTLLHIKTNQSNLTARMTFLKYGCEKFNNILIYPIKN